MKYQHIDTFEIKTYAQIKREHRNTVFPAQPKALILGVWKLIKTTGVPAYNKLTHKVVELTPVNFVQTWEVVALPIEEAFNNKRNLIEIEAVTLIQGKVDEYNTANGLSYKDIHSCALYKDMAGYTHQSFCSAIWLWQTSVWEYLRQVMLDILSGTRTEPTLEELLAELPALVY